MSEASLAPTLATATAAVQCLPSLPGSTRQLLGYLNDESVDLKIIVRAIECDQGLALCVLRLANSPFYGMSNKVQTINDAVVVLGFSNLHMVIVSAMAVSIKFPDLGNDAVVRSLFRHSLLVAISASIIARDHALDPNPLFLAGILHDMGILALMSTYPKLHAQARALAQRDQCLWVEAENAVFGFDHADIGAALCRHWNLPETIVQAVGRHHQSVSAPSGAQAWAAPDRAAGIVQLADAMAHAMNLEQDPQPRVAPVCEEFRKLLSADPQALAASYGEIERLYQELVVLIAN
jgi:putative nucleotidyltransferase with HDIG domain